jgi:hypothetical protein
MSYFNAYDNSSKLVGRAVYISRGSYTNWILSVPGWRLMVICIEGFDNGVSIFRPIIML